MFIPLKDNLRSINLPTMTIILIVANCLAFVMFESGPQNAGKAVVLYGAVPYEMTHAGKQCVPDFESEEIYCERQAVMEARYQVDFPGTWQTVGSSMFLHIGWFHLLGNMLMLFVFGRAVEDMLGSFSFLLFYLVGGAAAIVGHTLYDPNSAVPCVGASGAIAAVMGAYFILYPRAKVWSLFIIIPCRPRAYLVLGVWLIEQALMAAIMVSQGAQSGVAVFAHFGGFVAGCALTYAVVGSDEIRNQRRRARIASGDEPPPQREVIEAQPQQPAHGQLPPAAAYPGQPVAAPQFVQGSAVHPDYPPGAYAPQQAQAAFVHPPDPFAPPPPQQP